jgi:hypothetical protein
MAGNGSVKENITEGIKNARTFYQLLTDTIWKREMPMQKILLQSKCDRTSMAYNENFITASKLICIMNFLCYTPVMSSKTRALFLYLQHKKQFLTSCQFSSINFALTVNAFCSSSCI